MKIVFCVCHRAVKKLDQIFRRALGGGLKNTHRNTGILASDEVEDDLAYFRYAFASI